jgi:hypothetical protein
VPSSLPTEQPKHHSSSGSFLDAPWNFLAPSDAPLSSDLIFVLAGLPERKTYGLDLFRQGIAPRLILSVGRFEVRQMDDFGFRDLKLREKVASMVPRERHFFIELSGDSRTLALAGIPQVGTFAELSALAACLAGQPVHSLTVISTSIHLRRVRWCCRNIAGLREKKISYVPVPEEISSFRRSGWWRRLDHWSYLAAEYTKLLAYPFLFRHSNISRP